MFKKILFFVATITMLSTLTFATTITLYQDKDTGAIYTKPGPNRVELGDFISAKDVFINKQKMDSKIIERELKLKKKLPKVENSKSLEFLFGKQTNPNMKIYAFDNPDMWVKLGVRLQGTFENRQVDYKNRPDIDTWDAYFRRVRFEVGVGFTKNVSFTMDVRNDKANYKDKGEQKFNVGDAYLKIKKPFDTSLVNFKLYRGKIDVSRTETVKSAYVLHYDRPYVADEAAQFISHNRRGTNAKMYGNWKKKIHYEIAFGDGIHSGKFKDATGKSFNGDSFTQKSFFYGGKVILSPFDGWEEKKRTENYFGEGKHFEIGVAYWKSPDISYDDGAISKKIDHELVNLEMSAHYKGIFVQVEYFKFDGVVKKWKEDNIGQSNGWYVISEYVFDNFNYLAPFIRYEKWDKWEDENGYDLESKIAGVNWYLRGNSTKIGFAIQKDSYDEKIGDKSETRYKLTTQWFF